MTGLVASTTKGGGLALQPSNLAEAMKFAEMLAGSGMVPKSYQNKPQDTLVAMMMGYEVGLNPIQSLQNIAVINGKPSIYGDAALALVQNHPSFGGIEETFDEASNTAICTVWRKGGAKHSQRFSQEDAKKAGLWGKQGPWTQYPKRMQQMRARGFALRDTFADALAGLITREEAEDLPIDVTNQSSFERTSDSNAMSGELVDRVPEYPEDQFNKNMPAWKRAIESGKKTAEEVIATVSTKGTLTKEQQAIIRAIKAQPAAEPAGQAAEPEPAQQGEQA